ncbi:glycoside hydrolase domain-containing protein [Tenacibaculum sp. UWU-22]|uniref:glycoside hydrolase domain-containing protein n=1 Tax=Tenacibaculum sp. UWU-22 TaxID=3234187 RepID=UPI0034DB4532
MTSIGTQPNNLLVQPCNFYFLDDTGKEIKDWKTTGLKFLKKEAVTVTWQSTSKSRDIEMNVKATLEFDGFLSYTVKVKALNDVSFNDIKFHLPMQPSASKYLMDINLKIENTCFPFQ